MQSLITAKALFTAYIGHVAAFLRHGMACLRKSLLRFNVNFTELQMTGFNIATALYLITQSKYHYGEVPPFFTTLTHIAPPIVWIILMIIPAISTLWARHIDCQHCRWATSLASAVLWLFLTSFLWSSFFWASGKISVVHFFSPVVLSTAIFCNIRLAADRRTHARDRSPEMADDDGVSLFDCLKNGWAPVAVFAWFYLRLK